MDEDVCVIEMVDMVDVMEAWVAGCGGRVQLLVEVAYVMMVGVVSVMNPWMVVEMWCSVVS